MFGPTTCHYYLLIIKPLHKSRHLQIIIIIMSQVPCSSIPPGVQSSFRRSYHHTIIRSTVNSSWFFLLNCCVKVNHFWLVYFLIVLRHQIFQSQLIPFILPPSIKNRFFWLSRVFTIFRFRLYYCESTIVLTCNSQCFT